jgi:uncharacterized membrane protein (UPF0127 family)
VIHRRALIAGCIGLAWAVAACADEAADRAPAAKTEKLQIVTSSGKVVDFKVEVVDTPASRERGLMFRMNLAHDRGMLFDFQEPQPVAFWMKNTFIPLDIIFISPDGEIINIARRAKPFDETPLPSAGPIVGVLEINGGEADELGIGEGARVRQRIFERPLNGAGG